MTFDEQRGEEGTSQARHSIRLLCIGQEGSQDQGWLIYIHVEDPVKRSCYVQGIPT